MTLLTLPASPGIAEIQWDFDAPSQANRSEFTSKRRVTVLNLAPRWYATIQLVTALGEPQMKPWRAFLQQCQGVAGMFKLPATENVQTTAAGAVVVDGAGQEGFALATRGWTPAAYLTIGDFITVGDQLIGVRAPVIADGAGKATIPLLQYLRTSPVDGAAVEVREPWGVMSLSNSRNGWKVGRGQQYETQIVCEEAF